MAVNTCNFKSSPYGNETTSWSPRIAVIIPACNEEACIGPVLEELLSTLDPAKYVIAVGVNNSTDRTAEIARRYPVVVSETSARGYGYGCTSAIAALNAVNRPVSAYVFFAGDGASVPRDVSLVVAAYEQGYTMVLGARTLCRSNWPVMTLSHVLANLSLGIWSGLLSGRWFTDLAPLRLIERDLFEALALEEMTFGWTIEAQIAGARLGAAICEVTASERSRMAGTQKVSGVTWRQTLSIGCRILVAGWRTHRRFSRRTGTCARESARVLRKPELSA